ncbi:H-type lectin domain containing protein [Klebsormidium nitens]|uniref:H-type lectin domain containing protein n=1 Tax=Klebsormidium nitens TaxID=105231 RepID=A0A1Y1IE04_KLENI|nr:H-type lectin domain containing protein [Klebsormidium nitens]|eukprot:GAQ86936.1 H-type lectin domain containing protein [Klebsormidium nitens]
MLTGACKEAHLVERKKKGDVGKPLYCYHLLSFATLRPPRCRPRSSTDTMGSFVDQQQQAVALKLGLPPVNGLYVEQGMATANQTVLSGTAAVRDGAVKVSFKKAFNAPPVVNANLKFIDFGVTTNVRADVWVTDVTKTDFMCHFQTWSNSLCYGLQANWLAIGSSD